MAWKNMDKVKTNILKGEFGVAIYETTDELSAAGNGVWIMIPRGIKGTAVTVSPSGGATAKAQATTDKISVVKSGSPVAIDWSFGAVAADTQDYAEPVTAIRLVQIGAGASKISLTSRKG